MFVFLHPMHLSNEHISQFQSLYKEQFGEEISKEEAYEQGIKLLRLVQLIYKPMTQAEFTQVQNEIVKIRARINKKNQT
jgi:hypothetical protein